MIVRSGPEGEPELLVVHRPRYDDWTLPKGKAEPGESDEECALREVEEETGLVCELGPEVAVSEYEDAAGRPKRVRYFEMRPSEGTEAAPQNEIDDVCWLTRQRALDKLSYARDRAIVESLEALAAR
ncbi:MAG TPA: NUDIX hydrolase [Gaiellaceae bacterium]|nr:NUDIX hydrolase [Gaiellaceae bacterium]